MIRPRQILESVVLHYENTPTSVSVSIDGGAITTVTDLPGHTSYKTRRMSVPAGSAGYIPQIQIDSVAPTDHQFVTAPSTSFSEQKIWHYYEVTVSGDVTISLYLDEINLVDSFSVTVPTLPLSTTEVFDEYTLKVFFPPLSFGYIPHIFNATSDEGDIVSARPVALSSRFYNTLTSHSECRVTYRGRVQLQFHIDGRDVGKMYSFEPQFNSRGVEKYVTETFYLPSGTIGHVFQWTTVGKYGSEFSGDVAMLETDASLNQADPQPQVPSNDIQ